MIQSLSVAVVVVGVVVALALRSPIFAPTHDDPSLPILCASSVTQGYNRGNVTEFPGECFFADTYEDARDQFLGLAKQVDAELYKFTVGDSEEYSTDVAVLRRSKDRVVVHISGTHGSEGFAGSAVQAAALHQLSLEEDEKRTNESLPTLVFVHVLNPYGMKNNRRVNEDNIDLNRNFLTSKQWELALGRDPNFAHYVDSMEYVSPSHQPFPPSLDILNELYYVAIMSKVIITNMRDKMKRAVLSGNYHFPKGLGFGGQGPSQSFKNLDDFLKGDDLGLYVDGQEQTMKRLAYVDVHTGLGSSGVDTLSHGGMSSAILDPQEIATFEQFFPTEMSNGGQGKDIIGGFKSTSAIGREVFAGYDLMMGDVDRYCEEQLLLSMDAADKACMTQEFGTYSNTVVGIALVSENHMFHYGSKEQQEAFSRTLRQVFYIRNKQWTRAIVHRGMEVLLQAVDFANK